MSYRIALDKVSTFTPYENLLISHLQKITMNSNKMIYRKKFIEEHKLLKNRSLTDLEKYLIKIIFDTLFVQIKNEELYEHALHLFETDKNLGLLTYGPRCFWDGSDDDEYIRIYLKLFRRS